MSRTDDAETTKMNSPAISLNDLKEEDRISYLDFRARNNRAVQKWRQKQKNKSEEVRVYLHFKESGPKWTVQEGESGRSLMWTVRPKVDGLEPNWTVI